MVTKTVSRKQKLQIKFSNLISQSKITSRSKEKSLITFTIIEQTNISRLKLLGKSSKPSLLLRIHQASILILSTALTWIPAVLESNDTRWISEMRSKTYSINYSSCKSQTNSYKSRIKNQTDRPYLLSQH